MPIFGSGFRGSIPFPSLEPFAPRDASSWSGPADGVEQSSAAPLQTQVPTEASTFGQGGVGRAILGSLGDAVLQANHMQPVYGPAVQRQQEQARRAREQQALWGRQDAQRVQDRQWQVEDRDAKLNAPQYFMAGRDRVMFDPMTGESSVVYDGAEAYQDYASSLGYEPGTPDYSAAVRDYVLKSNGPTAVAGRMSLEGARQDNRVALRTMPTYAQAHPKAPTRRGMAFNGPPRTTGAVVAPILAKLRDGKPLSGGEQQTLDYYRRPRTGGRAAPSTGAPAAGAPPVGTVRRGFRFNGGDPRNKANWVAIR